MLPLLQLAGDGCEYRLREAIEQLAIHFKLTDRERSELLPSGTSPVFDNRVAWARSYLKQAGLLESPKRGMFRITHLGKALLDENPDKINLALLNRYTGFQEFRARRHDKNESEPQKVEEIEASELTPEDTLAEAYQTLRKNLENDLLEQIKSASPAFFERLVIDVLVAMGYGGSRRDAGRAIGKSGDGGIDGIIKEDKLGLDVIYVQAKRWDGTVGRPEIQKFAGALQGQRSNKGVFITTSRFTREAEDYVKMINAKIILIDGERLTNLMIDHNVGISLIGNYEIKKVDIDYFEGE